MKEAERLHLLCQVQSDNKKKIAFKETSNITKRPNGVRKQDGRGREGWKRQNG